MSPKREKDKAFDEVIDTMMDKLYIEKRTKRPFTPVHNPFRSKHSKPKKVSINYTSNQCKETIAKFKTAPCEVNKRDTRLINDITEGIAQIWNDTGYRQAPNSRLSFAARSRRRSKSEKSQNNPSASQSSSQSDSSGGSASKQQQSCAQQALYDYCDSSVTELAAYLDETLYIPRKMSFMAEMMYT